jgi:hypothetical protein
MVGIVGIIHSGELPFRSKNTLAYFNQVFQDWFQDRDFFEEIKNSFFRKFRHQTFFLLVCMMSSEAAAIKLL